MNSKIKYFLITAVLATAILCSAGAVSAQTDNSASIVQLQAQIANLLAQIQTLQSQQSTTPTPPATPAAWCHTFNTNLGTPQSGTDEVGYLHTALQKQGISYAPDTGNQYTGTNGKGTVYAVKQFQKKYGLTQIGYVGPATRKKLNVLYGCGTTPPFCTPNWQCGWGPCVNGGQSQIAIDSNNCGLPSSSANIVCTDMQQKCTPSTQPSIASISPSSGPSGLTVTVTGSNFTSTGNQSSFSCPPTSSGGGQTNVSSADGRTLTLTVPPLTVASGTSINYPLNCSVTVTNSNGTSNGINFTIVSPTTTPTITVTSPNGGEQYLSSNSINFSGTVNYAPKKLMAHLYSPVNGNVITMALPNGVIGRFSGTFTGDPGIGVGQYKINVCDELTNDPSNIGSSLCDSSDNYFAIAVPSTTPSITVTSPNGGEQWVVGSTHNITWTSSNIPTGGVLGVDIVKIETGGVIGLHTYLAGDLSASQNSWTGNLPTSLIAGNYKARVFCHIAGSDNFCGSNPNSEDYSDNTLSIVASTATCSNLYWIDNTNKTCSSPKQFCGAYMYLGLRTFSTQQECLNAVTPSITSQTYVSRRKIFY